MSLQKILEQIKKVQPYADEDVNSGAIETLSGRRARKTRSIDEMKHLKRQYKESLMRSAVFILVTGSEAKEFEAVAKEQFGCMSADPEGFYRDLASRVHPTLWMNKETNGNVFDVLGRHLEDLAGELDVIGYPMLQFKTKYAQTVHSEEEFRSVVKTVINEQVGGELVAVHAVNGLVNSSIKAEYTGTVTPIVLATSDFKLALDLVPALERVSPKVFLVLSGKGPKELKNNRDILAIKSAAPENVESALKTIKSNLKK